MRIGWVAALMASGCLSAAEPAADMRRNADEGWASLMETWHPKTGMLYGCPVERVLPARCFTNGLLRWTKPSDGYGAGISDCALVSGVALSMLCDKFEITGEAQCREEARKVATGLLNLARSHGYKGFVARGLCAEDGRSICALSSRDQVTHWVHGLWRYTQRSWCDARTRADFKVLMGDVADRMRRTVTPENGWNFLQADGAPDPRGICTMWGDKLYPHETLRLPMIYAAAWKVCGDAAWHELYERHMDEAIDKTFAVKEKPMGHWNGVMPTYSLLQWVTSIEVLLDIETNPARRARLTEIAQYVAEMAEVRVRDILAHPGKRYYGMCFEGELLLAQLMTPGRPLTPEGRAYLTRTLARPCARTGIFGTSHFPAAYWRARVLGALPES